MELQQHLDEQISALVDSECVAQELEGVISALSKPEYQQRWEIYHHIGDLLRDHESDPDVPGLVRSLDVGVLVDEPHRCCDQPEGWYERQQPVKILSKDFKYCTIV